MLMNCISKVKINTYVLMVLLAVVSCGKAKKVEEVDTNEWKMISKELSSTLYASLKYKSYPGYSADKKDEAVIWILKDRHDWFNDAIRDINNGQINPIVKSVKAQLVFDCKKKQYWVADQDTYKEQNGKGAPILPKERPVGVTYVEPNEQSELLYKFACEEIPPSPPTTVTKEEKLKRMSIKLQKRMQKEQILNAYGKPKRIIINELKFWQKPFEENRIESELWTYEDGFMMIFDAKGLLVEYDQ